MMETILYAKLTFYKLKILFLSKIRIRTVDQTAEQKYSGPVRVQLNKW